MLSIAMWITQCLFFSFSNFFSSKIRIRLLQILLANKGETLATKQRQSRREWIIELVKIRSKCAWSSTGTACEYRFSDIFQSQSQPP